VVIEVDGVRVLFDDGPGDSARASNTGPVLVLRFEAETPELLAQYRNEVESAVAGARAKVGV
jgi:phosphomannomutase / phosphoglucomutase